MNAPLSGRAAGVVPNIGATYGAALLGSVCASVILGANIFQTYMYYHKFPKDSALHKWGVGILCLLAVFHLCLVTHAVYHYLIVNLGQRIVEALAINWSIKLQVLVNVLIILLVQSLYAYRVWVLGGYHNSALKWVIVGVVGAGFIIGTVFVYCVYMTNTFAELSNVSWAVISAIAGASVVDFTITIAMCYYLLRSRGSEFILNTRISRVMQYILSSGLLTCAGSIANIFVFTFMPHTLVYLAIEFILAQIYALSFLAMMNSRNLGVDRDIAPIMPTQRRTTTEILNLRTPTSATPLRPHNLPQLKTERGHHRSRTVWDRQPHSAGVS